MLPCCWGTIVKGIPVCCFYITVIEAGRWISWVFWSPIQKLLFNHIRMHGVAHILGSVFLSKPVFTLLGENGTSARWFITTALAVICVMSSRLHLAGSSESSGAAAGSCLQGWRTSYGFCQCSLQHLSLVPSLACH